MPNKVILRKCDVQLNDNIWLGYLLSTTSLLCFFCSIVIFTRFILTLHLAVMIQLLFDFVHDILG